MAINSREWKIIKKKLERASVLLGARVKTFIRRNLKLVFISSGVLVAGIVLVIILASPAKPETEAYTGSITLPEHETGTGRVIEEIELTPSSTPVPTPTVTPAPTPTPDPTLERGMECPEVQELQERLRKLGYLELDESTQYFGPATENAVKLFQRQAGIQEDGIAGMTTLQSIYSDDAPKYVLKEGMSGADITALQEQLVGLGYMTKTTGYYGTETIDALKDFQSRNDLSVDGLAGEKTFDLLYSPDAKMSATKIAETRTKANISEMISAAKAALGKPYVLGATGPKSYDCSGLVYRCLKEAGSNRTRYNAHGYSQVSDWEKITDINKLKKGDLIFFWNNARSKIGHVGIIVSSSEMIDASSSNGKVVRRSYLTSYWKKMFYCGRRPW